MLANKKGLFSNDSTAIPFSSRNESKASISFPDHVAQQTYSSRRTDYPYKQARASLLVDLVLPLTNAFLPLLQAPGKQRE